MQGEKGVVCIVFAAQKGADTHFFQVLFHRFEQAFQLGNEVLFLRFLDEVDDRVHLFQRLFPLFVRMDLALDGGNFPTEFGGFFQILPHFGLFLFRFELGKFSDKNVDVQRFLRLLQGVRKGFGAQPVIVRFKHNLPL